MFIIISLVVGGAAVSDELMGIFIAVAGLMIQHLAFERNGYIRRQTQKRPAILASLFLLVFSVF